MGEPVINTPPPTPPTPPPAAPPAAAVVPSWTDGIQGETLGWLQNKGYKGPADLAESARNLEKLMGAPPERILRLAEKMRADDGSLTPEGRQIFERLGTPKEAKDYQIDIPKEYGDPQMAEQFRQLFHQEGLTKASAERIVKTWNERQAGVIKGMQEAQTLADKNADTNLRKDWGAAYDQNVNLAKEAARTMGFEQATVDALHRTMGQEAAFKFFHKLGTSVGEGRFVAGGQPNAPLAPAQADAQIKDLMKDSDFQKRFSQGDKEAIDKWTRLHEMKAAGQEYQLGQLINAPKL